VIEVDGKPLAWCRDLTLAQLMAQVDPKQEIAVVRLGDRLVSRPNFAATRVLDGAVIRPIPMVAGG
jgi:sulfur carrier protein ThiS